MTQELSFSKTIKQLYFNVDVKNASPDSVINEFAKLATEHKASTGMSSLSANLDMQMDGNVKKIFHFFKFINSPLPNFVVDKGYIKLSLGVAGTTKKILDIEWCFEFLKKADAEIYFDQLKKLFTPISTLQKAGHDELNAGQYAEFSTRNENEGEIRDVTFFLGKSEISKKFEIRVIPYNEFSE